MILFRIELVFKGRNFIILNHRRVIIALLTLLLIRGAGNNVPINPAWAYKEHYFPLRNNNKDNNVLITWVEKNKEFIALLH